MKILRILSILISVGAIFGMMYFFTPYRFFHKEEKARDFIIPNGYGLLCNEEGKYAICEYFYGSKEVAGFLNWGYNTYKGDLHFWLPEDSYRIALFKDSCEAKGALKRYIEEQRVIDKSYKKNSFPIRQIQGLKICN
jgi:hypothetical protein